MRAYVYLADSRIQSSSDLWRSEEVEREPSPHSLDLKGPASLSEVCDHLSGFVLPEAELYAAHVLQEAEVSRGVSSDFQVKAEATLSLFYSRDRTPPPSGLVLEDSSEGFCSFPLRLSSS